jgi:AcrR family transcriptional regulator
MSTFTTQASASKRPYRLRKRADKQQETRQRIVEAAVNLHSSVGPARTSIAQIAELAGVQRHTFYAHFPDERSLFLACSALSLERDPLPDIERWNSRPPGLQRVRHGLGELYSWYERNEGMVACVLRDSEHHQLTRETVELRMKPAFGRAAEVLGAGLGDAARPLLDVALEFHCWRALRRSRTSAGAATLMSKAVIGLASPRKQGQRVLPA